MSLRNTIASAVDSAWVALDDIPESVTYRRTTVTYDPSTGTYVDSNADITINIIFTRYQNFEVDRVAILATDVKGIIKQAEMGSTTPAAATDLVLRANGEIFNVLRYGEDPAGATFSVQLRSP